ncbi:hypothetical protein HYY69_04150 [Candidatus Woesearchaeota archaeon]|nr:hypothetical protein [Candidatus Woesearchaeota archaeon]
MLDKKQIEESARIIKQLISEGTIITHENYKDSVEDAEELLNLGKNKIKELVTYLDNEQTKRKRYTYDMGEKAELQKVETSLKRATEFINEISLALR